MQDEPLKECPFCGSRKLEGSGCGDPRWIKCVTCCAEGPSANSQREARTLWNTRTEGPSHD